MKKLEGRAAARLAKKTGAQRAIAALRDNKQTGIVQAENCVFLACYSDNLPAGERGLVAAVAESPADWSALELSLMRLKVAS